VACTGAAVGVAAGAQETSVIEMTRITPKMTISLDLTKVLITLSPWLSYEIVVEINVLLVERIHSSYWFLVHLPKHRFLTKVARPFFQPALLNSSCNLASKGRKFG
jgi:hypothetical protein